MSASADRLKSLLSEDRNLVLGSQILLGFLYRITFEPGYAGLGEATRRVHAGAILLLVAGIACLIATSPFHRIAQGGDATAAMEHFTRRMMLVALVAFDLALGAALFVALGREAPVPLAAAAAVAASLIAAAFWFGPMLRRRRLMPFGDDVPLSTKDKINELLTEVRIELPGVQALLGFQFAAYFTAAYDKLSVFAKTVHTGSLLLLSLSMVLLMAPAPFHQFGQAGEPTTRSERAAERFLLSALPPFGLGVSGDLLVVVDKPFGRLPAILAGGTSFVLIMALWFAVPVVARRRKARRRQTASAGS